tara:strand:+ start:108 stop:761 length:654 start_codon:yes stop_codon:yes gene_type:complete
MFFLNRKPKETLFIHIPKTAGLSIAHVILSRNTNKIWKRDKLKLVGHDPYFSLQENNSNIDIIKPFIFSVVRNPFTRTYSCYKMFINKNYVDISFGEFLDLHLKNKHDEDGFLCERNTDEPWAFFWTHKNLFHSQCYFLRDMQGNILNNGVNIFRFENLPEIEKKLSSVLRSNIKLPLINLGNKDGYYESYTSENIEKVVNIYYEDFKVFNYSLKFK